MYTFAKQKELIVGNSTASWTPGILQVVQKSHFIFMVIFFFLLVVVQMFAKKTSPQTKKQTNKKTQTPKNQSVPQDSKLLHLDLFYFNEHFQ